MHIVVVGLSHRTAPVEVREKLSIPDQTIPESLKALKAFNDILEVSILSTCNRLEIYALVKDKNIGFASMNHNLRFVCLDLFQTLYGCAANIQKLSRCYNP